MLLSFEPVLSAQCPPPTNSRASLRKVCEEQKMSVEASGIWTNADGFAGFHRYTLGVLSVWSMALLVQESNRPSGSTDMWTPTIGHESTADHWPICAAAATAFRGWV